MPWRIAPTSHNWVSDEYEVRLASFKSEVGENVKEFYERFKIHRRAVNYMNNIIHLMKPAVTEETTNCVATH